jgi:hypothetical protein
MENKLSLSFELDVPIMVGDVPVKEITLLRSNGASEKLFIEKLPEKPYTWIAYAIAASIKELGGISIASPSRLEYLKDGVITLPPQIANIPLAVANTLLIEIHKRIWKQVVKDQECLCKYCSSKAIVDIDLNRITYSNENLEILSEGRDFNKLSVSLPCGWDFYAPDLPNGTKNPLAEYNGLIFNQFTFKAPTLGMAIANEKYAQDNVVFWRRMAFDALLTVEDSMGIDLPKQAYQVLGLKLYNEILYSEDLLAIRTLLRDSIPTLPFFYLETCPTCRRETPVTLEGNGFFSD